MSVNDSGSPFDPAVLKTHQGLVQRVAERLLHDLHAAEDVAQDTWVAALQSEPARPRAWLRTVARRFAIDRLRSDTRRRRRETVVARAEQRPDAQGMRERERVRHALVQAVFRLPERYRDVILLRFLEDEPPRRVASQLGLPVETVRTRTRRALTLLREDLTSDPRFDRQVLGAALPALAFSTGDKTPALWGLLMAKKKIAAVSAGVLLVGAIGVWATREPELPATPTKTHASAGTLADAPAGDEDVHPTLAGARSSPTQLEAEPPTKGTTRGVVFWGVVHGPDGMPVAGAKISARGHGGAVEAESAGDGTFQLRGKAGLYDLYMDAGPSGGLVRSAVAIYQTEESVIFQLEPSAQAAIEVQGIGRVEALSLVCEASINRPVGSIELPLQAAARIHAPQGRYRLWVTRAGGWRAERRVSLGERETELQLEIPPDSGGVLAGRVVDEVTALPVAGARVRVRVRARGRLATWHNMATTDADGRFAFAPIEGHVRELVVEADEHAWWPASRREGYELCRSLSPLGAGEHHDVSLALRRGLTLEGSVTTPDGRAVSGVEVLLSNARVSPRAGADRRARTGPDGTFTFHALNRTHYELLVLDPSWAVAKQVVVDLVRTPSARQDLEVVATRVLRGMLRDEAGVPAVGGRVELTGPGSHAMRQAGRVIAAASGADGAWQIEGVPAVEGLLVRGIHGTTASPWMAAPRRGEGPLEISLGGLVQVALTLEGRLPAPEFSHALDVRVRSVGGPQGGTSVALRPDKSGRYVGELVPGKWRLTARQEGQRLSKPHEFELASGEGTKELRLRLEPGHRVSGRVEDADGRPHAAVTVELIGRLRDRFHGTIRRRVRTDAQGNFTIRGVGLGAYELHVSSRRGGKTRIADIRGDEGELTIVHEP